MQSHLVGRIADQLVVHSCTPIQIFEKSSPVFATAIALFKRSTLFQDPRRFAAYARSMSVMSLQSVPISLCNASLNSNILLAVSSER
jgi:hypothetical protein